MTVSELKELDYAVEQVLQELMNAKQGFPGFNSAHEGFSILNECLALLIKTRLLEASSGKLSRIYSQSPPINPPPR